MPRHILHITPYAAPAFAFGGVARAVDGLTRALVRHGERVTVLTTDAGSPSARLDAPSAEIRDGVRIVRIPNASVWARGRLNLSSPFGMGRAARDLLHDVDVVHLHELRTVENLLVVPEAHRRGLPIVVSPHGTLDLTTGRPILKQLWDALLTPATARSVRAVIALTERERADAASAWARFGPGSPAFHVVPNGVDAAAFATLPNAAPFRARWGLGEGPVVLFMGRLHPRKGVTALAEAFAGLPDADARLLVVGGDEGAGDSVRAIAARDSRIVVTGYLDGADRLGALACADVFALPAVGEGLPMAALEAMAGEIACLLSPGCNLPEAGQTGAALIVPPTVDAIRTALARLIAHPAMRVEMGRRGCDLIHRQFTWDAACARLIGVYATLTSRAG